MSAEKTLAALRPAVLDDLADDTYRRRRAADLGNAVPYAPLPGKRRRRTTLLVAGVAAGGLVAAGGAVVLTQDGGTASKAPAPQQVDARSILLASARTVEKAKPSTGAYWYTREREHYMIQNQVFKLLPGQKAAPGFRPHAKALPFKVWVNRSQDSWHGRDGRSRARTIVGIDRSFTFASPADEAKWKAMGAPDLEPWSAKQHTNNYDFRGDNQDPYDRRADPGELAKLPTDVPGLEKKIRGWLQREDEIANAHDGVKTGMSFPEFAFYEAFTMLSEAARPGTRAAFYRILSAQPGVKLVGNVKDLLGRPGVALSMVWGAGSELMEQRMIIDPGTGKLLGDEAYGFPLSGGPLLRLRSTALQAQGWVDALGQRPN